MAKKKADPGSTLILPSSDLVRKLVRAKKNAKTKASAATGEVGEQIAKAIEEKHLDRKALNITAQLDALDPERLGITYFHLLRYMDDLKIPERAANAEAEGLFEEAEMADDRAHLDDKVVPIGEAARKVAEQAGSDPAA